MVDTASGEPPYSPAQICRLWRDFALSTPAVVFYFPRAEAVTKAGVAVVDDDVAQAVSRISLTVPERIMEKSINSCILFQFPAAAGNASTST
jgi:hypothetical protein